MSQPQMQASSQVQMPVMQEPVVSRSNLVLEESNIDEAMELERLKEARRKRKNNGNKED